ncbi:MAG TPA: nuclear transport factor 2 family protein [Chloroflexota bacterium]|nr:nuclear transport factor 2 family protein [Chloroflexota bacterium]
MSAADLEALAGRIREALESADLDAYSELLHPAVRWGAPGDDAPPCRNRNDVLAWYRQGRAEGRRARVTEVITFADKDKIVVGMKVTSGRKRPNAGEIDRWQVLTIVDGTMADISGYERRQEALAAAGWQEPDG